MSFEVQSVRCCWGPIGGFVATLLKVQPAWCQRSVACRWWPGRSAVEDPVGSLSEVQPRSVGCHWRSSRSVFEGRARVLPEVHRVVGTCVVGSVGARCMVVGRKPRCIAVEGLIMVLVEVQLQCVGVSLEVRCSRLVDFPAASCWKSLRQVGPVFVVGCPVGVRLGPAVVPVEFQPQSIGVSLELQGAVLFEAKSGCHGGSKVHVAGGFVPTRSRWFIVGIPGAPWLKVQPGRCLTSNHVCRSVIGGFQTKPTLSAACFCVIVCASGRR